MSPIRQNLLPVLFPVAPAVHSPARASRSDFFKAALDAAKAAPGESTPAVAAPRPTPATFDDRPGRPGALLDIRI